MLSLNRESSVLATATAGTAATAASLNVNAFVMAMMNSNIVI